MEVNYNNSVITNYIINNVRPTHYHAALLVKELYTNKFCTFIVDDRAQWYQFNGSYWQLNTRISHQLNIALSNEILNLVIEARTILSNRLQNPVSNERIFEESRLKELETLTDYLYDNTFKKGVINECESLYLKDINEYNAPSN